MPHWLPAVCFGSVVALLGVWMSRSNRRVWREQERDQSLDQFDRRHYLFRYQRRAQLSWMIITAGVLLALGDVAVWGFGPIAATVFWAGLILLCLWIGLLAIGDFTSVQAHSQVTLRRFDEKRRELESELEQLKRRTDREEFQ